MAFQPPAFLYGGVESTAPMLWSAANCSQLLAVAAAAAAAANGPSSPQAADSNSSISSTPPSKATATPNNNNTPTATQFDQTTQQQQAHEQLASALLLHHQQQQQQHHQERLKSQIANYNQMITNQRIKQKINVQQAELQHNSNTHHHNDSNNRDQMTPDRRDDERVARDADHDHEHEQGDNQPESEPNSVHDQELNDHQQQHHHHQQTSGGRQASHLGGPKRAASSPYSFVDDDESMSVLDDDEDEQHQHQRPQLGAGNVVSEEEDDDEDDDGQQEFALNLSLRKRDPDLQEYQSSLKLANTARLLLDSDSYESKLKRTLEDYRDQLNGARSFMAEPSEHLASCDLLAKLADANHHSHQQQPHLNHLNQADKSYHRRLALLAGTKCATSDTSTSNNYLHHRHQVTDHHEAHPQAGHLGPSAGGPNGGSQTGANATNGHQHQRASTSQLLGHSLNGSSAASSCSSSASSSASSSSFCSNGWSSPERASISSPISSSAASLISAAAAAAAAVANCSRLQAVGGPMASLSSSSSASAAATSSLGQQALSSTASSSTTSSPATQQQQQQQLHRSLFMSNFSGPTGHLDTINMNHHNHHQHHQSNAGGHLRQQLNPHQQLLDQATSSNNHSLSNYNHHHLQPHNSNNNHNQHHLNQSNSNQQQQQEQQVHKADSEDLNRIRSFIEQFKARRGALGLTQKQAAQCFRAYTNDRYAFSDNFVGHFEGFQFRPQTAMTIADSLAEWLEFAENETRQGRQLSFMPGKVKETRKRKYEVIRIRDSAKRVLVEAFEKNRSPSTSELEQLSKKTNIPSRNIEIFFKNRRTSRQYHQ